MTTCPLCRRPTDGREDRCREGLDHRLSQIPGLYRLLADVLEPGSSTSARVSGTRTPPLPVRLEPLSLRGPGGITTILATWETYWRDLRGLPPVPARAGAEQLLAGETVVDDLVKFLRTHLDWAIEHDPAVDRFAEAIRHTVQSCHNALGLGNDLMKLGTCPNVVDDGGTPCGQPLIADPHVDTIRGIDCDRCKAHWTRAQLLALGETIAAQSASSSRTDHAA